MDEHAVTGCQRVVVKVGTSTLTDGSGRIDREYIYDLAAQLAELHNNGKEVILVTSGAIRAGREALGLNRDGLKPLPLPQSQAAAAAGQSRLMETYNQAFFRHEIVCAQILLTREDLADRRRYLNARNTLVALLSLHAIPIINENDSVSVDEIKIGDNDTLAALVAGLVDADLLIMLSDVQGLFGPDQPDVGRKVIRRVERIDAQIMALAGGPESGVGAGGMRTKVEAARIATASHIWTVIAPGRRPGILKAILSGEPIGTTFVPRATILSSRKRWIMHGSRPKGEIVVNHRAGERLRAGSASLLAVGIVAVSGHFRSGDIVEVRDEGGETIGRGQVNYTADEVRRVMGLHSDNFADILGYIGFDEIIHRNNLVIAEEV